MTHVLHASGSEQSKQIVFAPSLEPKFINVPQNNFVEPFVLNPGTWTVVIEAEGILLVSLKATLEFDQDTSRSFPVLFQGCDCFLFFFSCRITWSCCPAPTTKPPSCRCESPTPVPTSLDLTAAKSTNYTVTVESQLEIRLFFSSLEESLKR